ncbi:MAG: radical SAM protein [Intestinibaculum porci]|uniref:radical SAM protein n=1 Tax=Intestinibaculum porci TaxID=2487118 RepID=UPI003F097F4A
MEVNENNKLCNVMGLQMIVNTENGAVVGVDKDGIKQYKSIETQDDLLIKDKELYDFLIENDFIYYKKQRKKAGINISTAYVHVTNMCNLHCIGCYSNNKSRNRDIDLSKQDMFKVIDQLKSININQLVISGGEPLLRKDIIDIIEYAKDICKIGEIILITNGTIGDNDLYSKLTKWVDKVAVSLDTFNANVDHYLRDRGIYNKIIQNIRNMQVSGLKISILPTIHHKNVHYVEKYVELAKKLGTEISFSIFTTNNENIYEDFKLTAEDLKYIGENFADFDIHDLPLIIGLKGKNIVELVEI